jgi:hypothetical protein
MPTPSVWGPPTWTLLHTLAEKIHEDDFNKLMPQMIGLIKRICSYLPCPDCSQHATHFLAKLKSDQVSTKINFKNTMYLFHNMVNARKKKSLYNYANMNVYQNLNIANVFNNFVSVYNTKGNMKLLTESFQRTLIVKDLKRWLMNNINSFK